MDQEPAFDIEEELKKLPGQPGVYIMHPRWNPTLSYPKYR